MGEQNRSLEIGTGLFVLLGFAALALLPARAGDVMRPYMVARSEGLRVASVLATVVSSSPAVCRPNSGPARLTPISLGRSELAGSTMLRPIVRGVRRLTSAFASVTAAGDR